MWLEQFDVTILRHKNLLLGFQQHSTWDTAEVINLFDPDIRGPMHKALPVVAMGPLRTNERYRIYNLYARDPDGRVIEVQRFLHALPAWQ